MIRKLLISVALVASGCSPFQNLEYLTSNTAQILNDPSIPVPEVIELSKISQDSDTSYPTIFKAASLNNTKATELAFSGLPLSHSTRREPLVISLSEGTMRLGSNEYQFLGKIAEGTYRAIQKVEDPVWYAPDNYFTSRHLPVPDEASSDRFLRGYGEFGLFIDNGYAVHCNPISEVGGISMDCDSLRLLASYLLETDVVIVKS